jgi:hypothetical protein
MGELPLRGLLFLFGAFALLSAGLKARSTSRAGAGVALLTLVEALAGVVLIATTVLGVWPIRVSVVVGLATVALVLFSTTGHLFQLRSSNRAREESSGSRLYASVTYGVGGSASREAAQASMDDAPEESGAESPDDESADPDLPSGP